MSILCAQCKAAPGTKSAKAKAGSRFSHCMVCEGCYKLIQSQTKAEEPPKGERLCEVEGCQESPETDDQIFCPLHWGAIPKPLQTKLQTTWIAYFAGGSSRLYEAAKAAAIRASLATIKSRSGRSHCLEPRSTPYVPPPPPSRLGESPSQTPDWRETEIERDNIADNYPYKSKGMPDADKMHPSRWRGGKR